jgi:hypothetical protein
MSVAGSREPEFALRTGRSRKDSRLAETPRCDLAYYTLLYVGAPQHARKLHMTLPVRALMLSSARIPSRYGSSRMPLHPLLHGMILPVHAQHPCLVSSARSCIIRIFAVRKLEGTAANSTDKLARSRLTANWTYSHPCPVCVNLP